MIKRFNIHSPHQVLTIFTVLLLIIFVTGCRAPKSFAYRLSKLKKDTFRIEYEIMGNNAHTSTLRKHKSTSLNFLKNFNDTVIINVNYRKVNQVYINNSNYPYLGAVKGSEFSGLTYKIHTKVKKSIIDIELKLQKKYIEFVLDKKFPYCDIDHSNGNWTINYRIKPYEINIDIIKK